MNNKIPFTVLFPMSLDANVSCYSDNVSRVLKTLQKNAKSSPADLCKAIIADFWEIEQVDVNDRNPNLYQTKSSLFAVACEYMKMLSNNSYSFQRGGCMFNVKDGNYTIISLREIIDPLL